MANKKQKQKEKRRARSRLRGDRIQGWGLWDTKGLTWLGTRKHPLVYADKQVAMIAARAVDVRLGWVAGRTRVRRCDEKQLRPGATLQTCMSGEEALKKLESGTVL